MDEIRTLRLPTAAIDFDNSIPGKCQPRRGVAEIPTASRSADLESKSRYAYGDRVSVHLADPSQAGPREEGVFNVLPRSLGIAPRDGVQDCILSRVGPEKFHKCHGIKAVDFLRHIFSACKQRE
jgi:hypothetical protein